MLRFRTFGAVAVERDGTRIAAETQRRPLALLAIVARAGAEGVGRDRLTALLWPEHDETQGRNALRQVLFRLRRELGTADIVVGTTHLRLNDAVIRADAAEFAEALGAGDLARAAQQYRGPFLDGFRLPGAPEFERWVETERMALAHRATAALKSLAAAAQARGDDEGAVTWWRQLTAIDPLSSAGALGLTRALIASGDAAAALAHATRHRTLVRQELGIDADRDVLALIERVRATAIAPAPLDARETASLRPPADPPSNEPVARPALGQPVADVSDALAQSHGAARRRFGVVTLRHALVALALAVGAVMTWRGVRAVALHASPARSPTRLAVFPFGVRGESADHALGAAIGELLGATVDGAADIQTVDRYAARAALRTRGPVVDVAFAKAAAARLGAGRFVVGDVLATGGQLIVTAALYESEAGGSGYGRRAQAQVVADSNHVAAVVDELAIRLLAAADHSNDRFVATAARGTRSPAAFKAFLAGEASFRAGRYGPALDGFQRAVQEDTTYAIAFYRLSVAADWASRQALFAWASDRARRLAGRLDDHERTLLDGLVAWQQGDARAAVVLYRNVVTRYPDDAEAWYQLGETEFHLAPAYGSPVLDARHAFEQVLALDPGNREAMVHLQRIAARAGDRRAVDSLTTRLLTRFPGSDSVLVFATEAFATDDPARRARAFVMARDAADETVLHVAIKTAVYAGDLAAAREVATRLTGDLRGRPYQLAGAMYVGALDMALGRRHAAAAALAMADRTLGVSTIAERATLATLPLVPATPAELRTLRDSVERWRDDGGERSDSITIGWPALQPRFRPWVLGLLDLRLGDLADVGRQANRLDGVGATPAERAMTHDLAQTLRAEVARARGDLAGALALAVSETRPLPDPGAFQSLPGSRVHQRFLRGELLAALGQDDEALRWFASIGDLSVAEQPYRAPAELRQAELDERRGDRAGAAAHYRRVVALWKDCEPELRPAVADVERRLAALRSR